MFGYIKAFKPELKIREYDLYKGIYCSLCKELGKSFSVFARMTLSYDFVFVALLSMALNGTEPQFKRGRCPFNLTVRCNYVCNADTSFSLAANAAVIMTYYKLLDNIRDSGLLKKLASCLFFPFMSHARRKAKKIYPDIDEATKKFIDRQTEIEKNPVSSVDLCADPTARLLEQLFEKLSDNEFIKPNLRRLGYCLGRWVYLIDAVDDLPHDIKSGDFNPFKLCNTTIDFSSYADGVLTLSAGEAHKAYKCLNIEKYDVILDNILLLGLENQQKLCLNKQVHKASSKRQI